MAIPTQQKALRLTAAQSDFSVDTVPVVLPQDDEVLIRIEASTLSHMERFMQQAGYYITEYPSIVGLDAAGVVVALGKNVTGRAIGDRVLYVTNFTSPSAAHQQYAVMKAHLTAKVPASISFDQAATLPCNVLTAHNGLYTGPTPRIGRGGANLTPFWKPEGRGKYAGQPIVILGAAASVGQYAIQQVRISGFSPIIAVASLRNADLLKSLGATHVLDRSLSASDLISQAREITTKPIQVVYDAFSSAETQGLGYDILASGGALAITLPVALDEAKLKSDKSVYMVYGAPNQPEYEEIDAEFFNALPEYLSSGEIKPNAVEYLPGGLHAVSEGLKRLESFALNGKLAVHPLETA
ncbi:hypothetical protein QCA50_014275 [Cerrena zonata]|uniref:Enoyl reductase (ER) domain-containing protein n=1 Tax=Cerrena zonata TaxID=2478898 RepID=A0AAW0FUF7_9APHY